MRLAPGMILVAVSACSTPNGKSSSSLRLPEVYPPVRAATPTALIADSEFSALGAPLLASDAGAADAALEATGDGAVEFVPADAAGEAPFADAAPEVPGTSDAATSSLDPVDAAVEHHDASFDASGADPSSTSDGELVTSTTSEIPSSAPSGASSAPPTPPGGTQSPPPGGNSEPPAPGGTGASSTAPGGTGAPPPPGGTGNGDEPGSVSLATAIQQRFYSGGPTALLRIVKDLDERLATLDTDAAKHPCLTASPVGSTFALPGDQHFDVKLQCIQRLGSGFIAVGFDTAADPDGGVVVAGADNDFYFVEGSTSGMGGAYRVYGATGNIEAWIAVADRDAPNNSQVLMHLFIDKQAATLELALAGSGVGFCGAHLKTNPDFLFVSGRTNGVAPSGVAPGAGQYCDAERSGCFAASELGVDLGATAADCGDLNATTFAIGVELDASSDAAANVTPNTIYKLFNREPTGLGAL